MTDRTIAPEFKKVTKVDLQKAISGNLSNGIPLHIIDAGVQPVIKLELILYSGRWFEKKDGTSYFATKMLNEGTLGKTALQISQYFDRYGAFLEFNPGYDYNTIAVYVLTKHFSEVLKVFREILTEAAFPEDEFQILKNNTLNDLKIKNEKNHIVANRKFRELLYGNSFPYGKELTEKDVIKFGTTEELKKYFANTFFNKTEILASGQISDDQIDLIEEYFGDFKNFELPEPSYSMAAIVPARELIEKEKSSQSSVRIGKRMLNKNHPDYLKMLVVNEILGGYFGSRLMKNIREEKGLTYGIYSRLVNFRKEGYFNIGLDVKKEDTQHAIDEIFREIRVLQQEPVDAEELETVRNVMIGGFLSELSSPFALADKFKAVHFHGLDYSYYQNFVDVVNGIAPREIMELAIKYLNVDEMTEVVVGGK